ncbi:MAG: HPF/RaiA family ribosome-associated protein [Oleibacter sp.]|nr:HPF/RaiA family ribosome-associated protein [Thalassolituus sp.]
MKIKVQARHIALPSELKAYVKRRLQFALGSRADSIKQVKVTLSDINGPKGGEDKRCQMLIKIDGKKDIVIDDKQEHIHSAIDIASDRASRAITRRIERLQNKAKRMKIAFKKIRAKRSDNDAFHHDEYDFAEDGLDQYGY